MNQCAPDRQSAVELRAIKLAQAAAHDKIEQGHKQLKQALKEEAAYLAKRGGLTDKQ